MNLNPHGYETGFTIENHRDDLIERLGIAIRRLKVAEADQEAANNSVQLYQEQLALVTKLLDEARASLRDIGPKLTASRTECERVTAERDVLERKLLEIRFSPEGDNHHNAMMCPYCNPERVNVVTLRTDCEGLRKALENCRNGLDLLLRAHKPERPDDPFDTINELRQTVETCNEVLNARALASSQNVSPTPEPKKEGL